MKVSLNWVKKYITLPDNISTDQIAKDLTLKTVEVENVINEKDKFHDIVVGKILEVSPHPDATSLRVCMVDIGELSPVQIVCGGSNLYVGEYVVVSKPGSEVYWHGENSLVTIKETKMRGVSSYGMICSSTEVYLEDLFPLNDEHEIVDLKQEYPLGINIADALDLNDTILEIDNKSLSNRPDLWGHYGIARELSAIYNVDLLPLKDKLELNLPKYDVEIKDTNKCNRYSCYLIDNVYIKESPLWLKKFLINAGMRPINAIVDITNYVMLSTGNPTHAFDENHITGNKIIVRNAKENEKLLLLDDTLLDLDTTDLVIADTEKALCLAGIKGGKNDSVLPTTKSILLEVANFSKETIRKTSKKFTEKTDSSIRYEKGIDSKRVDITSIMALNLFKEIYPESKLTKYNDIYPVKMEDNYIEVPNSFLTNRLGKEIDSNTIINLLTHLGYTVNYSNNIYNVLVPSYRSTTDVSIKDDILGDIARLIGYDSFGSKPLLFNTNHAIIQNKVLLINRLKEYLSYRCSFYEVITYPWIDEKYIDASGLDKTINVELSTPPSPETKYLRSSLIPGLLEATSKNLRYFNSFNIFEMTEVFKRGEYHESSLDETLPIHNNYLTGFIVDKDPKEVFYKLKGILENMSSYTHMYDLKLEKGEKPPWADSKAYMDIILNDEVIGTMGLLSIKTMNDSKIKRVNVGVFELNVDKLIPYDARTNFYTPLPTLPLVEKDLSLIVDDSITYNDIIKIIKSKVYSIDFTEEYKGSQLPTGKKSITLRIYLESEKETLTTEEINIKINSLLKSLNRTLGAYIRE